MCKHCEVKEECMAGEGFKALSDPTRRRILELLRYSLNTTVMQDLIGWFMGFMDGDGNVNQANDQTDNK